MEQLTDGFTNAIGQLLEHRFRTYLYMFSAFLNLQKSGCSLLEALYKIPKLISSLLFCHFSQFLQVLIFSRLDSYFCSLLRIFTALDTKQACCKFLYSTHSNEILSFNYSLYISRASVFITIVRLIYMFILPSYLI